MATESNNIKKAMLQALKVNFGRVSYAAEAVGINRCTHYKWLEADEDYRQAYEEINEASIDFVESKLFEKITGVTVKSGDNIYEQPPSDTAIIFYLKTKGKKRGYIEKTEIDQTINLPNINLIMPEGE